MKGFRVFKRTKSQVLKDSAASATDYATALAKDQKFRKELLSAMRHGTIARRRAASRLGFLAAVTRLATDVKLKNELLKMTKNLDRALSRVEKKRSHKLRNTIFVTVGVGGAVAVALKSRSNGSLPSVPFTGGSSPRTIDESIEVNVPVSVSYNQWTQFEDFPLFMEGVEHVQQLDDTRLHWVATSPARRPSGTPRSSSSIPTGRSAGSARTERRRAAPSRSSRSARARHVSGISMSYQADPIETVGSAAGLDSRRVKADLERFKELVETRGTESGAWRGEVAAGKTKS